MTLSLARPELATLPLYNAGLGPEAVRAKYGVRDVVKLGSNESPFGPSKQVAAALQTLPRLAHLYPDATCAALRRALAARLGVGAEFLLCGNGSEHILELIAQAFLVPGCRVLTLAPCFGLHEIFPLMMGAKVEKIPVDGEQNFDLVAWRRALGSGTRAVLLANPSNPVGCMLGSSEFSVLIEAAPDDALLVIDEAYYEYAVREPDFPDALAMLRRQHRPWLVLRTFSKAYGLAGLRLGYAIASTPDLVTAMLKVRTPFPVNAAAQLAALAALNDTPHLERVVSETIATRTWLCAALRERGLRVAPSAANFLFVETRLCATLLAESLLHQGVIVKPWSEPGFAHWLRVSIGTRAQCEQFCRALDLALNSA